MYTRKPGRASLNLPSRNPGEVNVCTVNFKLHIFLLLPHPYEQAVSTWPRWPGAPVWGDWPLPQVPLLALRWLWPSDIQTHQSNPSHLLIMWPWPPVKVLACGSLLSCTPPGWLRLLPWPSKPLTLCGLPVACLSRICEYNKYFPLSLFVFPLVTVPDWPSHERI